mgnify:CR=1 FL=1
MMYVNIVGVFYIKIKNIVFLVAQRKERCCIVKNIEIYRLESLLLEKKQHILACNILYFEKGRNINYLDYHDMDFKKYLNNFYYYIKNILKF